MSEQAELKRYQCRHIFTDGRRCQSPALRQQELCYYHHTTRKPVADPKSRSRRTTNFTLPIPEDRSAIQAAIGEVLQRIANNSLDSRRAGLLLYGLQIAALNLPKPTKNTRRHEEDDEESEFVEETTTHPTLGTLAPTCEITEELTVVGKLLKLFDEESTPPKQPCRDPYLISDVHATDETNQPPSLVSLSRPCRSHPSYSPSSTAGATAPRPRATPSPSPASPPTTNSFATSPTP